ncbi:MAG: division/cell wall cluster transcriptional repressor MraZ [Planctomycetaceae bacterium]|nr:division/cell wall cluster transcriptional repressor MraZ [Planctomycetaceae bacterium]
MSDKLQPILGEYNRKLDGKYRLTLPSEFDEQFKPEQGKCVIAKERPGCLSLWDADLWKNKINKRFDLILAKLDVGDLEHKTADLQRLGRLLSTRHKEIKLAERARVLLPEGFREFLGIEPGQEVMVVGAIRCIELWQPKKWFEYVEENIPEFGGLLETLSH